MLPHRSVRCRPTNSTRTLLVIGENHSPWSSCCVGNRRSRAASGAVVALMLSGHWQYDCWSHVPANLFFAEACHVMRSCESSQKPSRDNAFVVVGTYVYEVGSNALAFWNMPAA